MKRVLGLLVILSLFCAGFLFAGGAQGKTTGEKRAVSDYKIVLILPGPINDQSWNATNYAGLVACNKELGTNMEYIENVQAGDYESTFRNYAARGYDLIMAAGTQFDEAASRVAPSYPDSTFCVVNGMIAKTDNAAPIFPKEYEASFLAGIIAAYITETGKIATVGGFPNKAMVDLLDVYEATAKRYAKEKRGMDVEAVRAYANSWSDLALGKQMAETMIDKGADVLFFYANQVGLGAIQAAKEKGAKFIGFSSNQNDIAPGTVLASIGFDFATFYKWAVSNYIAGQLKGGKVNKAGLREGLFVPYYGPKIGDDVKEAVEKGKKAAIAGEIDFQTMFSGNF
jgi:basic membrane protein A